MSDVPKEVYNVVNGIIETMILAQDAKTARPAVRTLCEHIYRLGYSAGFDRGRDLSELVKEPVEEAKTLEELIPGEQELFRDHEEEILESLAERIPKNRRQKQMAQGKP